MTLNFFIFLSFIILTLTFIMINLNNPIHAILTLISIFLIVAICLFSLGFEFLGFLLILVYASGISILFLFSVLFFNIKVTKTSFFRSKFNLIGSFIFLFLFLAEYLIEIQYLNQNFLIDFNNYYFFQNNIENFFSFINLSQLLYREFFIHLLLTGLILFFIMLGILVLILPFQKKIKKSQLIYNQLSRQPINTFIKIKKNDF